MNATGEGNQDGVSITEKEGRINEDHGQHLHKPAREDIRPTHPTVGNNTSYV